MRQFFGACTVMILFFSSSVSAGDMPPSQNQQQPANPSKPAMPAEKEQTKYLLTGCTRSQHDNEEHKQKDMKKPSHEEMQKKPA